MHASAHDDEHDDTVHHEGSDVNIHAIFVSAVALIFLTAFCYFAVWVTYRVVSAQNDAQDTVRYPLAAGQDERLPPLPRLQTDPKKDLRDLRAEEALILDNYRWVDRDNGVVRLPIEEAMKLTVDRGLPSRPAPAQENAAPPAPAAAAAAAPAAR